VTVLFFSVVFNNHNNPVHLNHAGLDKTTGAAPLWLQHNLKQCIH